MSTPPTTADPELIGLNITIACLRTAVRYGDESRETADRLAAARVRRYELVTGQPVPAGALDRTLVLTGKGWAATGG